MDKDKNKSKITTLLAAVIDDRHNRNHKSN